MATTTVHLLRHGEVDNPTGVLYGRLPGFYLSERGLAMAERIKDHLGGYRDRPRADLTVLIASPLARAQQTAAPLATEFGLTVQIDPRTIEAGNRYQGMTFGVGDGAMFHPSQWRHLYNPFRPSWGESYVQIANRMQTAVMDAARAAEGHEALMVGHQLPVWIARLAFEGKRYWHNPRRRQCGLASLTSLHFDGETYLGFEYCEPAADLNAPQ